MSGVGFEKVVGGMSEVQFLHYRDFRRVDAGQNFLCTFHISENVASNLENKRKHFQNMRQ